MKKYWSFFKIRFINSLQYRASAYAGMSTQFFWGFMQILSFAAFYKSNADAFPMKFQELSSYVWLQQASIALFMMWGFDSELFEMISSGNVAYELCRPMNLYKMWYTKNVAMRLSKTILRCIPILLVASFLPAPYGLTLPISIYAFMLFIVSLILAFLLVISFGMIIYAITFFTISSAGVRFFSISISEFFTGAIIPLPFLPDKIYNIFSILPWASMQNTPFRIYSGNLSADAAFKAIFLQIIWLAALTLAGNMLMNKGLKKTVVQGG